MDFDLNAEQRRAAHYKGEAKHLLILAGAGTGKTRTIIGRVLFLVSQEVRPEHLLMLTFTRRAAREMVQRLERRIGEGARAITAGTFHHFGLQVMRRMPRSFGVEGRSVIDRDDADQLLQLIRGEVVSQNDHRVFPKASVISSYISYAKNCCLPLEEYLQRFNDVPSSVAEMIVAIAARYEERKRQRNYLDFDDLLHLFAEGLEQNEGARIKLQSVYHHILVDEMQDTNPLQWRILKSLSTAHLFCVGDDAQSIYSFRGADFRNVHEFQERLPDSETLKLEENYRSTQEILDIANWLLDASSLKYNKRLTAVRGGGKKPVLIDFESKLQEGDWIARDIMSRHEGGALWHDHMVLVRSAFSAKATEGAMIDYNIPYRFVGGMSLLEAAHVKDTLCMCRAALQRRDELAWVRYLKLFPKVGDSTAAKVTKVLLETDGAYEETIGKVLKKREEIWEGLEKISGQRRDPPEALRIALEALTPLLSGRYDRWSGRRNDILLLIRLAEKYRSLEDFLEAYTLDPVSNSQAERQDDEDVVTIITVHSAKGTECPVCYCVGVQPGNYPHLRSIGDRDAEEEERRILYVALTRAKDELVITRSAAESRTVFHGGFTARSAEQSYLLEDLPFELVDYQIVGYESGRGRGWGIDKLDDF